MSDHVEIEEEAVVPLKDIDLPDAHPGVDDGTVDAAGETIVHELDANGDLIGWHKLPADRAKG